MNVLTATDYGEARDDIQNKYLEGICRGEQVDLRSVSKVIPEPEDVRKFMDEKVGKMSVKMALREEIAKVARDDAAKERKPTKARGMEEIL